MQRCRSVRMGSLSAVEGREEGLTRGDEAKSRMPWGVQGFGLVVELDWYRTPQSEALRHSGSSLRGSG